MKKATIMSFTLVAMFLLPANLLAQVPKREWFGDWAMNHDGHVGTLRVAELRADCGGPAWCDMAVSYLDSRGVRHAGRIEQMDGRLQHMVFYINFPNNRQKFDAYIFSWDRRKLAGTTYWGGKTFGFYATRR